MIQFNAHFDGKVITPDERVNIPVDVPLRVTIEPSAAGTAHPGVWERLLDLANDCALDGPEDLAKRHDHYAHGKPL